MRAVRGFRDDPASQRLEDIQRTVRDWRLLLDLELAEAKRRAGVRANRQTRWLGRSAALHEARAAQGLILKAVAAAFTRRRLILDQIADACAWVALRGRTRFLYSLFRAGSTPPLPRGIGLAGPLMVIEASHRTGAFLVLQNDLTSCLRVGDITVTRTDGAFRHPLVWEVKTKGGNGGEVTVTLHGALGGLPVDRAFLDDFVERLGFGTEAATPLDARGERQVREIVERSEMMDRISRAAPPLDPGNRNVWRRLNNLLTRALYDGATYDVLEQGAYALAVRTDPGAETTLADLMERVGADLGCAPKPGRWRQASLDALLEAPGASALLPPIPLWLVDVPLAVALLTGKLFYAGCSDIDAWVSAFARRSLRLIRSPTGWTVKQGRNEEHLDPIEVAKLETGVLFAGVSPDAVATAFAREIAKPRKASAPS